jgi:hypothetical protein
MATAGPGINACRFSTAGRLASGHKQSSWREKDQLDVFALKEILEKQGGDNR